MASAVSSQENAGVSETKPTDPDEIERISREEFSRRHAAAPFRDRFNHLVPRWHEYNALYFDHRLVAPRFSIAPTANRRISETRLNTDYGARTDIVFSPR